MKKGHLRVALLLCNVARIFLHSAPMKTLSSVFVSVSLAVLTMGCSRAPIEAIELANDGDKVKASNLGEAISKYEQATTVDPSNHRILWKLMLAYEKSDRQDKWEKIVSAAQRAEKLAPTFANYFFKHGLALARQAAEKEAQKSTGDWTAARGPLEETIQKDTNIADAHFELAEVMLHLDDEQAALKGYTKAIDTNPTDLSFYVPLIDLLMRLGYVDQGEAVAKEGLSFGKEGNKHLFGIHSLLGSVREAKNDTAGAVTEYELAKKACEHTETKCTGPGENIAFFNLGHAYASLNPPKKSEAMQQLTAFQKTTCRGAAATRYADQCATAQQDATRLGGALQ